MSLKQVNGLLLIPITVSVKISYSSKAIPNEQFANISANYNIVNHSITHINDYSGGVYQQAVSGLSITDQDC